VMYYILVSGKVQGVFFRSFAKEKADLFGIRGYAKNLENGKLEICVAGSINLLDRFVDYIKKGPSGAEVTDVMVKERTDKPFRLFEILY